MVEVKDFVYHFYYWQQFPGKQNEPRVINQTSHSSLMDTVDVIQQILYEKQRMSKADSSSVSRICHSNLPFESGISMTFIDFCL